MMGIEKQVGRANRQHSLATSTALVLALSLMTTYDSAAAPVPGYVPPVQQTHTPEYADDTRGVYVPSHPTYRMQTERELQGYPSLADGRPNDSQYLSNMVDGYHNLDQEINRIAKDPGMIQNGAGWQVRGRQVAQAGGYNQTVPQAAGNYQPTQMPYGQDPGYMQSAPRPTPMSSTPGDMAVDGGVEVAAGRPTASQKIDLHNGIVRLREERVSIRRALRRMMDQVGGGEWAIVWDLAEQNAGLPDMEISIYAEEPFVNVMNAMLARLQTRSGKPLRVVRYDRTNRLVVTDRTAGETRANASSIGVEDPGSVAVTENVLKDTRVSLHYDEIPLVDALENIVHQAGKGQWRLRMYAGTEQVLKPAHVEEPFNIAIERLLKLFNLKYEIFPGGKLIVITHSNRFGFNGIK